MSSSTLFRTMNLFKHRLGGRNPNAFILASVVSGFAWYFTNQQVNNFNIKQQELIERVEKDVVHENFKTEFNYQSPEDWDCKKVNLDGVLKDGRFFVKRNRGKQEGYLVFAPFIISTVNHENFATSQEAYEAANHNRKFVLNMGWIPKSIKHLVFITVPEDILGEETYTQREEAIQKQSEDGLVRDALLPEFTVPVTNITCYIRRGEKADPWNGRQNFKENYLFKYIDLNILTRAFRVFNEEEGETVYLERTIKNDNNLETLPIPASKQSVIEELKNQAKFQQNTAKNNFWIITGSALGVASWITFL